MKTWLLVASAALAGVLLAIARRPATPRDDSPSASASDPDAPPPIDWTDRLDAAASEVAQLVLPTPVTDMTPSFACRQFLKGYERLSLTPYRLGDGGSTLGWGRFFPDSGPPPPASIDRATADAWFDEDIEERGARWVRTYVKVPLTQGQFDALTSMAYNLSPKSFRTIADAVNAGNDPEAAALRFVRAGTNLEAGLRARRAAELALYRSDSTFA